MKLTIKKILTVLIIFTLMSNCNKNVQSSSEGIIDLENFDFSTKISTLIPKKSEDKTYPGVYNIKNTSLQKDTVFQEEMFEERKPLWIEYRQFHYRNTDELAKFGRLKFNTINIASTLQNEITVMNGIVGKIDKKENEDFITALNKKYGKALEAKKEFINEFDVYTWETNDRIIKYVPLFEDESNTMKIEIDADNKTINEGEKNPHYKGLLFIVNTKYANETIGKFRTGDMIYCQ